MPRTTSLTAEERSERARKAANARWTPEARLSAKVEARAMSIAAAWPELTPAQKDRLANLLRPIREHRIAGAA